MQQVLDQLNTVRGVGGCLMLSADGLPMASALRSGTDENAIAASVSAIIDQSTRLCSHLQLGKSKGVQCLSSAGGVLVNAVGKNFLAIIVDPSANLALLQLETRPFAERINQLLTL
jgi:predicted regulator of Ras-like GTPase activity (Roadblock/LC7/MglB family)